MSLKKYLLAGGLSTVLLLGACNGDDTSTEEETDDAATEETDDSATDDTAEDTATEDDGSADDEEEEESTDEESGDGEITYSGEYGEFTVASYEQYTLEPEEAEEEEEEEEGEEAEEAEPTDLVLIEFEFTNNSDVPTSPEEAFGLDLAVRQMAEAGENTLENLTMDLPEDHEQADLIAESIELVEPGESATALVAYGPLDTSLETVIQSRNDEELDETLELDGAGEAEEDSADDEEEEEDSEE